MSSSSLPERPDAEEAFVDLEALTARLEWALGTGRSGDGRRVFERVLQALIEKHPSSDGTGREGRLRKALVEIFGDERVLGRPPKDHEQALLHMTDGYVADRADRKNWEESRHLPPYQSKPRPRRRGSGKLAEAAAVAVYESYGDDLIKRLQTDFDLRKNELLDLRERLKAEGDAEKETAHTILSMLEMKGLAFDDFSLVPVGFSDAEELVY